MKYMVYIIVGILILASLLLPFFSCFDQYTSKIQTSTYILTLAILIWYAYSTFELKQSSMGQEKHLRQQVEFMQKPSIGINLGYINTEFDVDRNINDFTTVFEIQNNSLIDCKALIYVVFCYGNDKKCISHSDQYYSGKLGWILSAKKGGNGNFKMTDVFKNSDIDSSDVYPNLKSGAMDIEVAVFSKSKSIENGNQDYNRSAPCHYYLGLARQPVQHRVEKNGKVYQEIVDEDFIVWIWDPKEPSIDMANAAKQNGY